MWSVEANEFFLEAIAEQKAKVLLPTACTIERLIMDISEIDDKHGESCSRQCVYAEKCLYWVMRSLRADGLWPVTELNARPLYEIFTRLQRPALVKGFGAENTRALPWCNVLDCAGAKWDGFGEKSGELVASGKQLVRMVKPLCYKCVREGKVLDAMCRH